MQQSDADISSPYQTRGLNKVECPNGLCFVENNAGKNRNIENADRKDGVLYPRPNRIMQQDGDNECGKRKDKIIGAHNGLAQPILTR